MDSENEGVDRDRNFGKETNDANESAGIAPADGAQIEGRKVEVFPSLVTADISAQMKRTVSITGEAADDIASDTAETTDELVSAAVISTYKKEQFDERELFGTYGDICVLVTGMILGLAIFPISQREMFGHGSAEDTKNQFSTNGTCTAEVQSGNGGTPNGVTIWFDHRVLFLLGFFGIFMTGVSVMVYISKRRRDILRARFEDCKELGQNLRKLREDVTSCVRVAKLFAIIFVVILVALIFIGQLIYYGGGTGEIELTNNPALEAKLLGTIMSSIKLLTSLVFVMAYFCIIKRTSKRCINKLCALFDGDIELEKQVHADLLPLWVFAVYLLILYFVLYEDIMYFIEKFSTTTLGVLENASNGNTTSAAPLPSVTTVIVVSILFCVFSCITYIGDRHRSKVCALSEADMQLEKQLRDDRIPWGRARLLVRGGAGWRG